MNDDPEPQPVDPAMVKYLRLLVTILTITMIAGFLVIVSLFVTRFSGTPGPDLPDAIDLPANTSATAFTQGQGWYAVVTDDDRILIYDRAGGALRQTINLE